MPEEALPHFALDLQRLYGSSRFSAMHGFKQGIYLLLLSREWGFRGRGLPEDESELMRLCNLPPGDWQAVRTDVLQFFDAGAGRLRNETCEALFADAMKRKAQAQAASNARWRPDGSTPAAKREHMRPDMPDGMPDRSLLHLHVHQEEPPQPPEPPDGDSRGRRRTFFEAAKDALGLSEREAGRLQRRWPELSAEDLERWRNLPRTRPELFEGVDQVRPYVRTLAHRYGTVERADLKPPKRKPDGAAAEAKREDATARRTAELKASIAAGKREAVPPPENLAELAKAARRNR